MNWKIEITHKPNIDDNVGKVLRQDIMDLGITDVDEVRTAQIYYLEGNIDSDIVCQIALKLLADPITQNFECNDMEAVSPNLSKNDLAIEVQFKLGVTDAVGQSVEKGISDLGIMGIKSVQTGRKYWIKGNVNHTQVETIACRLLSNEVIETFDIY
ncbi:hypothetical protein CMK21_18140 [Candidatus Poribacteria bacterium]|jgi:phosphoribosylformylglycinamidine (FGAM) synthase PurS component|nr:hypothetical protein [Candidatus Poribacteria bacterium]|tara:strand:+ start:1616 stop:2083 length:468 start_codon:yes stop_codon:yes gene_type:complete